MGASEEPTAEATALAGGDPSGGGWAHAGRPLAASFATSGAIQALNVVTGVVLARQLGPQARGELAAVLLWPALLATLGSLGLFSAATYYAARGTESTGDLVATSILLGLGQSAVFVALGLVVVPLALGHYGDSTVHSAYLYLAYVPLNVLSVILMGVVNGRHRLYAFQALRLLVIVATAALLVALAVAGRLTVTAAVAAYLVANLLTLIASAALALREAPPPRRFSRGLARKLLGYGLRSHTTTFSMFLNQRLDQLAISIFLSPALLGLYVIAVTMTSATTLIGLSAGFVALPALARLDAGPERSATARVYVVSTLVGSAAVTVPILILTPQLIELFFGTPFLGAVDACRVLLVAGVAFSTSRVLEAVLQAVGRPLDAGIAEGAALAFTAAGLAVLLPTLELVGAGLASLLAYTASVVFMVRRATRALEVTAGYLLLPDRATVRSFLQVLRPARFGSPPGG